MLAAALIFFLASALFLAIGYNRYDQLVNYWGENYAGNGYWLHPHNRNLVKTERRTRYQGQLLSINKLATDELQFNLKHTLDIVDNQPEQFSFRVSNLVNPQKIAQDSDPVPEGWFVRKPLTQKEILPLLTQKPQLALMVTEDLYPVRSANYISALAIVNEKNYK